MDNNKKIQLHSSYFIVSILLIITMIFISCDKATANNKTKPTTSLTGESSSTHDNSKIPTDRPTQKTTKDSIITNIEFKTIDKGFYSGISKKQNIRITSQKEFNSLWNKTNSVRTPAPIKPEINFSKNTIIAVYMGIQNTGGYSINVDKVTIINNKLNVKVKTIEPPKNVGVDNALTSPYHIIKIPVVNKNIEFE